jgi:hypothetical protein
MNRELVEWDIAYSDQWDDRGHYTKDEGEYPCVWGMAISLSPAIIASVECLSVELEAADDFEDHIIGIALTSIVEYADECGIAAGDIFDNDNDFIRYAESMILTTISAYEQDWNEGKIHETLVDSLSSCFTGH